MVSIEPGTPAWQALDNAEVADYIATRAAEYARLCPGLTNVVVRWKERFYIGGVQPLPLGLPNVVYLTKSTHTVPDGLVRRLRAKGWVDFTADDELELDGRNHIVRQEAQQLRRCTPEQTQYCLTHPMPAIIHLP